MTAHQFLECSLTYHAYFKDVKRSAKKKRALIDMMEHFAGLTGKRTKTSRA